MKKIYAFFALSFLLFSASFSFADARHDRIIQSYIEIRPKDQNIFYTLDTIEGNSDLNNAHLILMGQELINNKDHIHALLQRIPDLYIILDVEENDGLVINGSLSLRKDLASYIRRLTIMNLVQDVRMIGDRFLLNCNRLTQLDLLSLSHVTQIGNHFLLNCYELTQLDFFGLDQVTQVGHCFLFNCGGLSQLDLSPSSRVTQIGNGFLSGCDRLTQLDLSPLNRVTQIGNNFLSGCRGLIQLDLSPLSQVTEIGEYSLCGLELTKFNQIKLPTYNPNLKAALEVTFFQDTNIGDMIREVYVEGYIPVQKNTKGAR